MAMPAFTRAVMFCAAVSPVLTPKYDGVASEQAATRSTGTCSYPDAASGFALVGRLLIPWASAVLKFPMSSLTPAGPKTLRIRPITAYVVGTYEDPKPGISPLVAVGSALGDGDGDGVLDGVLEGVLEGLGDGEGITGAGAPL